MVKTLTQTIVLHPALKAFFGDHDPHTLNLESYRKGGQNLCHDYIRAVSGIVDRRY